MGAPQELTKNSFEEAIKKDGILLIPVGKVTARERRVYVFDG